LKVMPPAGWVGLGLALIVTFGAAVVGGELSAVGLGAVGLSVIAPLEVWAVATSLAVTVFAPAHPPVRRTTRPTTDHRAMLRGLYRYPISRSPCLRGPR
jgi:hypothetical protein